MFTMHLCVVYKNAFLFLSSRLSIVELIPEIDRVPVCTFYLSCLCITCFGQKRVQGSVLGPLEVGTIKRVSACRWL